MCDPKDKIESHVIRVVKPRKEGQVGDMANVSHDAEQGPQA